MLTLIKNTNYNLLNTHEAIYINSLQLQTFKSPLTIY